MPDKLDLETHVCGFCLQSHPLGEFDRHGLNVCVHPDSTPQASDWGGAVLYDTFTSVILSDDDWIDVIERVSAKISTDYERLSKKVLDDEATENQTRRVMQVEARAEQYVILNFVKRLCATYEITIGDLSRS